MTRCALTSALLFALALSACQPTEPKPAPEDQAAWMMAHAERYLHDRGWRRAQLEASLWQPELPYARKRLNSYALPEGGWDLLREINPLVAPVRADGAPGEGRALMSGAPRTLEGWQALGERVFWELPMRRDAYMEWVAGRPELWDEVGLEVDEAGNLRGLTRFEDARGESRVGLTCALCHGAGGVPGRASRALDLGLARVRFNAARGLEAGVFATWGPGRVDVTNDALNDPLAIKDLWGVPHLSHLNTSGSVRVESPASLAIRFETQYTVGHAMEARPSRTLMWALAIYVLTLDPPATAPEMSGPGAEVFERACGTCHDPARGFSGGLVGAEVLNSDPTSASSPMRGTGFYKTPSLLGISQAGPFLHDGSQPTLTSLLDSGHPFGRPLEKGERQTLLNFLETL